MNALLKVLKQRRAVRRDLATAAALRSERRLAQARQQIEDALAALERARLWREAVLGGQSGSAALGGDGLVQSCEALVQRQLQAVHQAKAATEAAHVEWREARARWNECEQACLRTDEMLARRRIDDRHAADLREQALDEEILPMQRPGMRFASARDTV